MYGRGDLVRIDLSSEKISREPVPAELCRKFMGGEGINAWLLWEHFLKVNPRIDPLSGDNVLILGTGPLASTGFGAGSKMKVTYKSPAYNIYGDTSVGGGFSSQLRWAGVDHIVVTGRARHPVYIWVNDDSVEIRDARNLWGKGVSITDSLIKEELGDEEVEIACVGQAGENLVRFASVIVGCHRAGGRGGGGCVFGTKNLKAIAARGTRGLSIYDPQSLLEAIKEFREIKVNDPGIGYFNKYGTLSVMRATHKQGILAYRNQQGHLVPDEKIDKVDHNWYVNNIGMHVMACSPGCAFACGGTYYLKGDESPGAERQAGQWGTKPEFGSLNPFATACDIPDLPECCHLNNMCNEYGMDVMETAMEIAFIMELWERKIIDREDIIKWAGEPLSLEWGNYETVEKLMDDIGLQKTELGRLLSGGVYQTALKIEKAKNVPVRKYANYGKGGSTHEAQNRGPGGFYNAVANIGAHHLKGSGVSANLAEKWMGSPVGGGTIFNLPQATSKEEKDAVFTSRGSGQALSEYFSAIANSLGVCYFLCGHGSVRDMPLETESKALLAVTGLKMTPEEMVASGERTVNIQKAFNSRLGLRREDDTVCNRWMNEPVQEGTAKGIRMIDYLEALKDGYYEYHGWDKKTSLQTRKKLEELGMKDVARVLARDGALSEG